MEDGLKQGHDQKYYETIDQRFLGEEPFVKNVAQRSEAREAEIRGKRVSFGRLLHAISEFH